MPTTSLVAIGQMRPVLRYNLQRPSDLIPLLILEFAHRHLNCSLGSENGLFIRAIWASYILLLVGIIRLLPSRDVRSCACVSVPGVGSDWTVWIL